jgi:LCP family protein required for cell wall assembly
MTDWPDDWFRDAPGPDPQPPGSQGGAGGDLTTRLPYPGSAQRPAAGGREPVTAPRRPGAAADPAVSHGAEGPAASYGGASYGAGGPAGASAGGQAGGSAWPAQPAARTARGRGGPGRPGGPGDYGGYGGGPGRPRAGWARSLTPRRVTGAVAVLIALAVVGSVITYFTLDAKLTRKNVLVDYSGRPGPGSGTNWLITGSDSRQGLSRAEERKLATGHDISGHRSDTIMVLHLPSGGGRPVLISLPRDSWVPIPGHGYNKINAAYSFGGPRLLAETVQNVTGLRISHYMGIGFGGFVRVVNAIGGVRMCLKAPLVDRAAGLHLHKGCQVLDGAEALGFVRSRHNFATQDLQRIQNQRVFLAALLRKLTGAGTIANPFRAVPAASGLAGTLTVDMSTHLLSLLGVAFALRHPTTTTVPIAGSIVINGEDALQWNTTEARQLFRDLNAGKKIPKSLITGSKQAG